MKVRFTRRSFVVGIVVLLATTLVPLQGLPVAAAESAATKATTPDKLPPLGTAKTSEQTAKDPVGDFAKPPAREGLVKKANADVATQERDHYETNNSRLVKSDVNVNVYDNGDGTESVDLFSSPVNFQDNGTWKPIDSTLRLDGKKIASGAGPVKFELEQQPTSDSLAKVSVGANSFSFTLEGLSSKANAELKDNTITYRNAISGADLTYQLIGTRLKESIILKEKPSKDFVYRSKLKLDGLSIATDERGQIAFKDEKGNVVIAVEQSWAWDSSPDAANGARIPVETKLSANKDAIETLVPQEFLDNATYPLTIDPTYAGWGYNGSHYNDGYVSNSAPNTSFYGVYESGVYVDKIGYNSFPSSENYMYLNEDLSFLDGKQILDARFEAFFYSHSSSNPIHVHPVSGASWDAYALTWNNKPTSRSDQIVHQPASNAWTNLNVTSWVQNWTNGTWPNYGLQIDTAGQNAFYKVAAIENGWSMAPKIHVTYNNLPSTSQPTAPADNVEVMTPTPTLTSTTITDPDGDTIKYWFRVSATDNPEYGQVVNSGWQTSPSWTIPAEALVDGMKYTWYVITWDGNSANVWYGSGWRRFTVNLHVGEQPGDPYDTQGPLKVNLVSGNVMTSTSSPSIKTIGGDIGISYSYNSLQQANQGLTGKYYDGCGSDGTFPSDPYLTRQDSQIDFNWGTGSPGNMVGVDDFCVEWDGYISAPLANTYCFDALQDDGLKVWVDGTVVIDRYDIGGAPTGSPNPCVALYMTSVPIHIEYFEHQGSAAVQLTATGFGITGYPPVPASWLTSSPMSLPQGWQLSVSTQTGQSYNKAIVSDSAVLLEDSTGFRTKFDKRGSGATTSFDGPDGVGTTLILVPGPPAKYVAQADDGLTYTFNDQGALESLQSSTDDTAPASAEYIYDPGVDTARLKAIKDPISGRQIELKYSRGLGGGSPCTNAGPGGFSPQGPPGMLCEILYPDGLKTVLYYSAADNTGQLMRIIDPGQEVTDFSYYATGGLLARVADPYQMDYRANHPSAVGVYAQVSYAANKAWGVVLASPNGTDNTDAAPTTNRPWHTYSYTTPFDPVTNGETRVHVSGLTPSQGFARKVTFNPRGQTLTDTDQTGVTTINGWDSAPEVDRLLSVKNDSTQLVTTTIYDTYRDLPTDSYGPAAPSCFNQSSVNVFTTPNGTCSSSSIAHTATEYDGGIGGLNVTWWNNATWTGTPAGHTTQKLDSDWGSGSPAVLGSTTDYFSARATGEVYLAPTGNYQFDVTVDDSATLWIDDQYVLSGSWGTISGAINLTTGGWHRIRLEYKEVTGLAKLKLAVRFPGDWGNSYIINEGDLRPRYDLVTKTTTDDSTTGSPGSVTTTNYGTPLGTFDPAYGIALSTSSDPTGQNLTNTATYEAPHTASQYIRQLTKVLPGGNTTSYSYYGNTETIGNPCTGTPSGQQAGMLKTKTSPSPASGSAITENFIYNYWGAVIAYWKNSESPTCTSYDVRGRVTTVNYPAFGGYSGRTVNYSYSVGGDTSIVSVTDDQGTVKTTSDLLSRTISYEDTWGNVTTTTYDHAGRVTDTAMPGDVRHVDYDSNGRLSAQKQGPNAGSLTTLATPTYNSSSEVTRVDYQNSTYNTFTYDASRRVNNITANNSGGVITSDAVTRSQSGRIVDQSIDGTDPYGAGNNFTYDSVGRLTQAKVPGHSYNYNFSPTGGCGANTSAGKNTNRTSFQDNGGTAITYCYDNADRLTSTTDSRYSGIAYDAHGNTTSMGGQTMTYDGVDRHMSTVASGTTVAYVRDSTDRIVRRTVSTTGPQTIALRASATAQNGSGATTVVVNKPTGTVQNDVMLAQIAVNAGTSSTITPPAGWTQVTNRVNNDLLRSAIYWKAAGSSEPSSYTFTIDSSRQATAAITSYSGVNTTTPINAWGSNNSTVAQNWFQNGSITTTVANALEISYCAVNSNPTIWQGNNQTERYELATTSNGISMNMSDRLFPTAGVTGNVSGSFPTNANSVSQMLALTPGTGTTVTSDTKYTYSGPGDSPASVTDVSNNVLDRTIPLLGGVTKNTRSGTDTWNYSNIHGDITAQANSSGTKQGTTFTYTPYGESLNSTPDTKTGNLDDGWLGAHSRLTEHEATINTIEMGARQYIAGLGRFIEVDPVEGGSANDYEYTAGDPVNLGDLNGETVGALAGAALGGAAGATLGAAIVISAAVSIVVVAGYLGVKWLTGRSKNQKQNVFYRYMSWGELRGINNNNGLLRSNSGTTYFTTERYSSAKAAQQYLALPNRPQVRVGFQIIAMGGPIHGGTPAKRVGKLPGGGIEFWTHSWMRVRIVSAQGI